MRPGSRAHNSTKDNSKSHSRASSRNRFGRSSRDSSRPGTRDSSSEQTATGRSSWLRSFRHRGSFSSFRSARPEEEPSRGREQGPDLNRSLPPLPGLDSYVEPKIHISQLMLETSTTNTSSPCHAPDSPPSDGNAAPLVSPYAAAAAVNRVHSPALSPALSQPAVPKSTPVYRMTPRIDTVPKQGRPARQQELQARTPRSEEAYGKSLKRSLTKEGGEKETVSKQDMDRVEQVGLESAKKKESKKGLKTRLSRFLGGGRGEGRTVLAN